MIQYISKAAVVAEIERRMQELRPTNTHKMQVGEKVDRDVLMWLNALTWVKKVINTLEVKEMDLEKEINTYMDNEMKFLSDEIGYDTFSTIAKHFFELGIQQSKKIEPKL